MAKAGGKQVRNEFRANFAISATWCSWLEHLLLVLHAGA